MTNQGPRPTGPEIASASSPATTPPPAMRVLDLYVRERGGGRVCFAETAYALTRLFAHPLLPRLTDRSVARAPWRGDRGSAADAKLARPASSRLRATAATRAVYRPGDGRREAPMLQRRGRVSIRTIVAGALAAALLGWADAAGKADRAGAAFAVDGRVALSSFVAIADGHLLKMADSLKLLAQTPMAQSADWRQIERPLAQAAELSVPALNWFALPDGTYWSVQNGREEANLSGRSYFPKVLAGQAVLGELVISKATGKSTAIVAVPVRGAQGAVVGVLGASVYLDQLSERIREQMRLGPKNIFFSFDAEPRLALVWDPDLIFANPRELGPEIDQAFTEMLSRDEGTIRYTFRGLERVVLYRKSPVTGWRYAFGVVRG